MKYLQIYGTHTYVFQEWVKVETRVDSEPEIILFCCFSVEEIF